MKKEIRIAVYEKFEGHCAYCGEKIEYKEMQVDHIEPLFRNDTAWQVEKMKRVKGTDNIGNLTPACRQCNLFKKTYTIEQFRSEIFKQLERVNGYSANYRMAKKYGLVVECPKPILFYYEKVSEKYL